MALTLPLVIGFGELQIIKGVEMAEKKFRSWVGFKEEAAAAPTENAVERIRQLETQLADLR